MSDIQSLINMLQSNDHNKRYDACEQLRISPLLPPEALDALQLAINDSNSDVADAAQRAIALHTATQQTLETVEATSLNKKDVFAFVIVNMIAAFIAGTILVGVLGLFLVGLLNPGCWETCPLMVIYSSPFLGGLISVIAGVVSYKKINSP